MPTYDYQCDACGHAWELFQKITDDPEKKCPDCKKNKARRLFGTGAAIMFKGSGFYETDYRSESYKKGASDEKKKTDGKDSGSESKTDKGGSVGTSSPGSKSAGTDSKKTGPSGGQSSNGD